MNDNLKETLNVVVGLVAMTMVVYGTVRLIQAGELFIKELTKKKD